MRGGAVVPACRQAGLVGLIILSMKYTVYVLKSRKEDRIYIGFMRNLKRRLKEHGSGHNSSTKAWRPYKLIYKCQANTRKEARIIEKELKKGYNREKIKKGLFDFDAGWSSGSSLGS